MGVTRAMVASSLLAVAAWAQTVIPLAPGAAGSPGKQYFSKIWNLEAVTNVETPTLTVYRPEAGTANGAAVVICPGGGFHALNINREGVEVAQWLAKKGVTAFVLRYRLAPTGEDGVADLVAKLRDRAKFDADVAAVIPRSIEDGLTAVAYVRSHAAELGVAAERVGILGFSAGGTVTAGAGLRYSAGSRPSFIAPIYPYLGALAEVPVRADAPPAFVLAASDDGFGLAPDSVKLYSRWLAAGWPAELHLYAKGGHGFGMRQQGLPSDGWIQRFWEWLGQQGFVGR